MMRTITTILESRDFITAALQVAGLLTLAGFWLLYFVRYHRAERERRHLAGRLLTFSLLLMHERKTLKTEDIDKLVKNGRVRQLRCVNCGALPWEPRA